MKRSMKILVIDDEPDIRNLVQFKLQRLGHEVTTAANGEDGLERALSGAPDLVLLDITMPGMTGLEVCDRLRGSDTMHDVSIILMSARAHGSDVQRGVDAGSDDYLVKPFSPRELLARVDAISTARTRT